MRNIELYFIRGNGFDTIDCWLTTIKSVDTNIDKIEEYKIPGGYTVEETQSGELAFYDKNGKYCPLTTNQLTKQPFILTESGDYLYLKPAEFVFNNVKELRKKTGLTQRQFADYFGMSCRTVENWDADRTNPPDYLVELMEYKLRREGIIE